MSEAIRTELTLPNAHSTVPLAEGYVRDLAVLAGLADEDAARLVEAAHEACRNILTHAFEPGERGSYRIAAEVNATELALSFFDEGLPFDPDSDPADAASSEHQGKGLTRIRAAVDEAHWINHGREGKELHLIKYRPHADARDALGPDPGAAPAAEPLAPPQEYAIRRMRPEEALGVVRCIYRVYGYSYHHEEMYRPERIVHLNEVEELVSIVAVDESGDVAGHYALERPDPTSRVAESGVAVVAPAHRGRRLMPRMREQIEAEGRRLGLAGIFSSAVTTHVFSQRSDEEYGCSVCGISLALVPRSVQFKKIVEGPLAQRVSCVLYYKPLEAPASFTAFVPARHRELVGRIYERLGAPVRFGEPVAPSGPDRVSVQYRAGYRLGSIRVSQVGADTAAEIRRARADLCDVAGAEVVYLELPLAQPGTPAVCEAAEAEGFFFCGIGPAFLADGDALRLQYVVPRLDPSLIQIASPHAREILDYALAEQQRTASRSTSA
jgi:anti-sigma regulatory factor (Ser/Thr protein kinase)